MGTPAITKEELLLAMAVPATARKRTYLEYRRLIILHELDNVLLRGLVEDLLNNEHRPQRLSELKKCDLTPTIDATWRWTVVDEGENPYYISDEVKSLLSWVVPVLHLKYMRADNSGTDDIQVLLSRRGGGHWIVLLKLHDRTLINTFDPYDTEGLLAGILVVVPKYVDDPRPQTGLHGYDELLLEIYECLVNEEERADEKRKLRLETAQRMTSQHILLRSFFCPSDTP